MQLKWQTFLFLAVVMGAARLMSSLHFGTISMLCNESVDPHHRATMNGLSMVGGSAMKMLGPSFSGVTFAYFVSSGAVSPRAGTFLSFAVVAGISMMVGVSTLFLPPLDGNAARSDGASEKETKEASLAQPGAVMNPLQSKDKDEVVEHGGE